MLNDDGSSSLGKDLFCCEKISLRCVLLSFFHSLSYLLSKYLCKSKKSVFLALYWPVQRVFSVQRALIVGELTNYLVHSILTLADALADADTLTPRPAL